MFSILYLVLKFTTSWFLCTLWSKDPIIICSAAVTTHLGASMLSAPPHCLPSIPAPCEAFLGYLSCSVSCLSSRKPNLHCPGNSSPSSWGSFAPREHLAVGAGVAGCDWGRAASGICSTQDAPQGAPGTLPVPSAEELTSHETRVRVLELLPHILRTLHLLCSLALSWLFLALVLLC